ncbi:uncharacterized protein VTP21DRAFT_800 [Calcarisporiella thermophila]|uniref:uncharacterized protein n=1 Tax=Calcarisporiella thermophila TaxID=911321 RepID=UPI0037434E41
MSYTTWKKYIEDGDHVIIYLNRENMSPMVIKDGDVYNNKFGSFRHNDIIGKEYGSKLISHTGKGFIYVLHPTPELWTQVLRHRTQILYVADISFITTFMDLKPGSKIIESGTGSGSFSHSLARTVAPHGKVYTFEYHEERARIAREEFKEHGLEDIITIQCRDVCKEGFDIKDEVHAVFLDLPAPWEAIPHAKETFKQSRIGKICCFSPCIEQVTRTCAALSEHGFHDIVMYENLIRNHDTRSYQLLTVEDAIANIKAATRKRKREEGPKEEENKEKEVINANVTKLPDEVRGHTSYLTFATFRPVINES